jgi:hypothetical protein
MKSSFNKTCNYTIDGTVMNGELEMDTIDAKTFQNVPTFILHDTLRLALLEQLGGMMQYIGVTTNRF